jgi:hypothetical protein
MKFCGECGTPCEGCCPLCGFANPPRFEFSRQCGASWSPSVQAPSPTPIRLPYLGPVRYTPSYLAAKTVASRSALGGEDKQVMVLCADLLCSLELLATCVAFVPQGYC